MPRIGGVYYICMGFYSTLFKYLEWGPRNEVQKTVEECRETLWTFILFINNWVEKPPRVNCKRDHT